ncbi:hypothetical protein AB0K51_20900 [Kitasatospora sp. NPDC049285]|uniref:hypothetical protein n=1 Tax=Kitasatospora sp. NPDC049285 TaxID=3157096 RepID=UPI003433B3C1
MLEEVREVPCRLRDPGVRSGEGDGGPPGGAGGGGVERDAVREIGGAERAALDELEGAELLGDEAGIGDAGVGGEGAGQLLGQGLGLVGDQAKALLVVTQGRRGFGGGRGGLRT